MIVRVIANFFQRFKSKKPLFQDPTRSLIKDALPRGFKLDMVESVYSLLAVEYKESTLEELKQAIRNDELLAYSKKHPFNSLEDAIEVLLFVYKDNTKRWCLLFSPAEYFENECVIDWLETSDSTDLSTFPRARVMYRN